MAVLSEPDRIGVRDSFMRLNAEATPYRKPDVKAAVDALDNWLEANAASANQALPPEFRNGSTALQKTALMAFVTMRRAGFPAPETVH